MEEKQEIIKKLLNGEIKLYEIDKYTETIGEAVDIRSKFVETVSNTHLEHLSNYSL